MANNGTHAPKEYSGPSAARVVVQGAKQALASFAFTVGMQTSFEAQSS
jgi:hypothetical protein